MFKETFVLCILLVGLRANKTQCLQEKLQFLTPSGRETLSGLTSLDVQHTQLLEYSHGQAQDLLHARMLSSDREGNSLTEDIFDPETGKRCTGYTEHSGQKYCRKYINTAQGSKCRSWGVLYKGTKCLDWGTKYVTVYVTETEKKSLENPEYHRTIEQVKDFYEKYLIAHSEYNGIELEQRTQENAVKLSHERKWASIEQEWLANRNKDLERNMLQLSSNNRKDVQRLTDAYERKMREITERWSSDANKTQAFLRSELRREERRMDDELRRLRRDKQNKISDAMRIYRQEYRELKEQFRIKYNHDHQKWKRRWTQNLLQVAINQRAIAVEKVRKHYDSQISRTSRKFNRDWSRKHRNIGASIYREYNRKLAHYTKVYADLRRRMASMANNAVATGQRKCNTSKAKQLNRFQVSYRSQKNQIDRKYQKLGRQSQGNKRGLYTCLRKAHQFAESKRKHRESHFLRKRGELFRKLRSVGFTRLSKFPIPQPLSRFKVEGRMLRARRARRLCCCGGRINNRRRISNSEGKRDYYYHSVYLDENVELLTHTMKDFRKEMKGYYHNIEKCYKVFAPRFQRNQRCESLVKRRFDQKTRALQHSERVQKSRFRSWWYGVKRRTIMNQPGQNLGGNKLDKWTKEVFNEVNGEFGKYWKRVDKYRKEWLKGRLYRCNRPTGGRKSYDSRTLRNLKNRDMGNLNRWFRNNTHSINSRSCKSYQDREIRKLYRTNKRHGESYEKQKRHLRKWLQMHLRRHNISGTRYGMELNRHLVNIRSRQREGMRRALRTRYLLSSRQRTQKYFRDFAEWRKNWNARHSPAHNAAITALSMKKNINNIHREYNALFSKHHMSRSQVLSKTQKALESSLTELNELKEAKRKHHLSQHERNIAAQIARHETKIEDIRSEIRKRKRAPENYRKYFEANMRAEIRQMKQLYSRKMQNADRQLSHHKRRYKQEKHKLQRLSKTITTVSTKMVPRQEKRKHCQKKIYGFSRTVKRYKCVTSDADDKKVVCRKFKVVQGKVTCVDTEKISSAKTCETFEISKGQNGFKCSKEVRVWPKAKCVSHFHHDNLRYCKKYVFLKPRFFCEKYTVMTGKRYCVQVKTIYGKKYHVFVCVKTGKAIKSELMDNGLGGPQALRHAQKEENSTSSRSNSFISSGSTVGLVQTSISHNSSSSSSSISTHTSTSSNTSTVRGTSSSNGHSHSSTTVVSTTSIVSITTSQITTVDTIGFSTTLVSGHNNNRGNTSTAALQAPLKPQVDAEDNVEICNKCLEYRNLVSQAYYELEETTSFVETISSLTGRRLGQVESVEQKVRENIGKFDASDRRQIESCLQG